MKDFQLTELELPTLSKEELLETKGGQSELITVDILF